MQLPLINIAICTCQRPRLLEQCLDSIAKMLPPLNVNICVSVVDNDPEGSAKGVVAKVAGNAPFAVHYFYERRRGIPVARNHAIEQFHNLNADFLVFIDDDEWVEEDWLLQLYSYAISVGGEAVISGPVQPEFPDDTPLHIQMLFDRKLRETGRPLETCATNNVLIPAYVTKKLGLRFDESRPLAGGTDTLFFLMAASKGVCIYNCAEAVVHELVPKERLSLTWLCKRKYRVGVTLAERRKKRARGRSSLFLSSIFKVLGHALVAMIWVIIWRPLFRNKAILKASRNLGVMFGCVGGGVNSYLQVDNQG